MTENAPTFATIFLLGAGNVAWHLSTALAEKGCRFLGVYNRTPQHAETLAEQLHCPVFSDLQRAPKNADLYLICTSDSAIAPISALLPENFGLVTHVSGSTSINSIDKKHHRRGVFYPLQTFNKNRFIDLQKVPFLVEAENKSDTEFLLQLGRLLSETMLVLNEEKRKVIHLSAVFACNFTNFMYALSADILKSNELDFKLLFPLIEETAARAEQTDNPMSLQTGPAARNDIETIRKHLELLKNDPELKQLYQMLSDAITNKIIKNQ